MKALIAQCNYIIGDFEGNTQKILGVLNSAKQTADIVVFSELSICGYPPEDLLFQEGFVEKMDECLQKIVQASEGLFVVVGLARKNTTGVGKHFYNSAAIIENGKILGFYDKCLLPTYDVFDEARYFEPGHSRSVWEYRGKKIAIFICEDIWHHAKEVPLTCYARDPVLDVALHKIDYAINISASPFHLEKLDLRIRVCKRVVQTLKCPLILCCQIGGNDQLVFDGYSLLMGKEGDLCFLAKGFEEDFPVWDLEEPKALTYESKSPQKDLFSALVLGVRDYFHKSGFKKACLGLSGGIDSAVVACIAAEALGKEHLLGLSMPSRYTSSLSKTDAKKIASRLGISFQEISIESPFQAYLDLLDPYFEGLSLDTTEENLQARIRCALLMAFSNKFGHVVLSTGNKSEMALGYMTLYGDLSGGLSVIGDLTKRQVYDLARYINQKEEIIPFSTIERAPSAELRPNQKDSDSLPSYDVLDLIVQSYVEQGKSAKTIALENNLDLPFIADIIQKIHRAEYKRRQAPPSIRVSQKSFREGRKVPIVQKWE